MKKKEFNEDTFLARLDLRIMALSQLLKAHTHTTASMNGVQDRLLKNIEEAYNTYNKDFAKLVEELDKAIKDNYNE